MVNEPAGYPGLDNPVGALQVPASYVVYSKQGKYYADSMAGGSDISSGTDAATVINNAISSLPSGGGTVYVKPPNPWATIPLSTSITLKSGLTLRGQFPNTQFGTQTQFEQVAFNNGTVFAYDGTHAIDPFTGNTIQNCVLGDFGVSGFTANNGIKCGASNTLGLLQSTLERIVFSNVALPINVQNFQYLTMRQIYAWNPTTNFILAQTNNTTVFGGNSINCGNSYWEDLYAHGCKNVNGAVSIIAVNAYMNMLEVHRLQINMLDSSQTNSTSGYGLYLQGQSATALCANNSFYDLDIEGKPLKAVRLEDYANFNKIHISLDILSAGGFDFSLKKNATTNAPVSNMLIYNNNVGTCNVESDSLQNTLISSLPLTPVTGAYPAGISGFGPAVFNGTQFSTMYGGGPGHDFVGATTNNVAASTSTVGNITTFALPTNAAVQNVEVGGELKITAFTSGTIQIQVAYTDRDAVAQTIILPLISDTGTITASAGATGNFRSPTVTLCVNTAVITVKTIGNIVGTWEPSGFIRATA